MVNVQDLHLLIPYPLLGHFPFLYWFFDSAHGYLNRFMRTKGRGDFSLPARSRFGEGRLPLRRLKPPLPALFQDFFEQKARIISLKMTEAVTEETWVGS